ncbi:beta-hexosaminidase [Chlamydia abortus]|nr:beta-hexosaminidase [Chlamydia abortus]
MNLQEMNLREKVAQLFTFPAFASALDEDTRKLVTRLKAGGIFLGTSALIRPRQVGELCRDLQQASLEEGSGIPLFIAADLVAGAGCKLREGAVHFPKNRAIGAGGDEALAYESGRITAEESLAMGVNFNYSPVVDINNNPLNPVIGTHSFGEDADTVSRLGRAVIRGYQEHGMIATAKHFPGHGDTHVDSHEALPVLPFGRERLESFELAPFREAIRGGVDAVMVGHIAVPAWDDSSLPASLSYTLTTGLLRERLNFQGLIVTDGLSMKGITNQFTLEEACVRAVQAGADILLATVDSYEQAESVLEAVVTAVEQGEITEARIEESARRILQMKQKYRLTAEQYRFPDMSTDRLNSPASQRISRALADQALTPLRGLQRGVLAGEPQEQPWILIRDEHTAGFAGRLRSGLPNLREESAPSYEGTLALLSELPEDARVLLAVSHNKPMGEAFTEAADRLLGSMREGLWIHFGSEYDVRERSAPCLLAYDRAPSLQASAAAYLLGEEKVTIVP